MAVVATLWFDNVITGFTYYKYGPEHRSFELVERQSLMGLLWTVLVQVKEYDQDLCVEVSLDCDTQETKMVVVYPAKLWLCVMLPDGELVAEREGQVRHQFVAEGLRMDRFTDPALGTFLGQLNNILHQSFTVQASITVYDQPNFFHGPSFQKSLEMESSAVGDSEYSAIAGYHQDLDRVVFWRIVNYDVTCWSIHPLIPSSLEQLGRIQADIDQDRNREPQYQAALSEDGCLTAYITKGRLAHTYDLFVLHLGSKELVHRRYENAAEPEMAPWLFPIEGLTHTRRGWVMFYELGFYRLAERMEELWVPEGQAIRAASYNCLFASFTEGNRIDVWDLESGQLSSHSYKVLPNRDQFHYMMAHKDKLYTIEYGVGQHIINSIEFGENGCVLRPYYGLMYHHFTENEAAIAFDGKRLMVLEMCELRRGGRQLGLGSGAALDLDAWPRAKCKGDGNSKDSGNHWNTHHHGDGSWR